MVSNKGNVIQLTGPIQIRREVQIESNEIFNEPYYDSLMKEGVQNMIVGALKARTLQVT